MTYNDLWRQLAPIYGDGEAKAVVRYLLEVAFNLSSADIYCGAVERLEGADSQRLSSMVERLKQSEPVQYVVGLADFCGRQFEVDHNVLIPRPETEELCQWIISDNPNNCNILDIGTGSGCIAVTLALDIANANVEAWDISDGALTIAKKNADKLNANVAFDKVDALAPPIDNDRWNIIVSNPPYICNNEKAAMHSNVKDFEPSTALFVDDATPLLFYQSIAQYAQKALRSGGTLYFEINPLYAKDIERMLTAQGYTDIEIRRDQFGKQRMTKATKP